MTNDNIPPLVDLMLTCAAEAYVEAAKINKHNDKEYVRVVAYEEYVRVVAYEMYEKRKVLLDKKIISEKVKKDID